MNIILPMDEGRSDVLFAANSAIPAKPFEDFLIKESLSKYSDDHTRTADLSLVGLALFFCVAMTAAFWPGVGTWEVLQFALQRKLPVMNDWKSPFVASLYWLSDDFFKSTGPILLTQQALFWSGLALLARSTLKSLTGRIFFFLAVAILPPVWITGILLWKEAWTISFLALSIGAMFAYLQNRRAWYAGISLLAAILLTTTRHNALLLTLPVFYAVARTVAAKFSSVAGNQRRMIFIAVFSILLIMTLTVNWAINSRGKQHCHIWHQSLLWDLAALSLTEGKILIPDAFRKSGEAGSLARIRRYFTYYNSDPLFFGPNAPLRQYGTAWSGCTERPPLDILLKGWFDSVWNYPGAYLRHSLFYCLYLLGIPVTSQSQRGKGYYRIDSEVTPERIDPDSSASS